MAAIPAIILAVATAAAALDGELDGELLVLELEVEPLVPVPVPVPVALEVVELWVVVPELVDWLELEEDEPSGVDEVEVGNGEDSEVGGKVCVVCVGSLLRMGMVILSVLLLSGKGVKDTMGKMVRVLVGVGAPGV